MISCVVLTKNEEENIVDCLESLQWCDEIIVIDDYSEDRTMEILKQAQKTLSATSASQNDNEKIKIFQRHLDGDFANQRNYGLEKAAGEWVLFVDADERVTPELAKEIGGIGGFGGMEGFYIKRRDFLFGRWLEHGETADIKFIRLLRKNKGKWERRVHEELRVLGAVGDLREPLLHYPHQTMDEFLREINFYTDLNAQELYQKTSHKRGGLLRLKFEIVVYPLAKFVQNYFVRLGFLDGMAGFLQAILMSFHSFMTRGKLWEMQQRHCEK